MFEYETYYLAGPMRSRPFYNAVAFENTAELLRDKYPKTGFISPAELDQAVGINLAASPTGTEPLPAPHTLSSLMRRDLDAIDGATGVITLPGSEYSTGAQVEVAYAKFLGKPVYSVQEFL